jgi:hypothetical protein
MTYTQRDISVREAVVNMPDIENPAHIKTQGCNLQLYSKVFWNSIQAGMVVP